MPSDKDDLRPRGFDARLGGSLQDMLQQDPHPRIRRPGRLPEGPDDAVFLLDAHTRHIRACNPAARMMFGYEPQELFGHTPEMLHLDGSHSGYFDARDEQLLRRDGFVRGRFTMRHRNGTTFVATHTMMLVGESDGAETAISIIHDESGQAPRSAFAEMALSEDRFRALFMDYPLPLWLCERGSLRFLEANGAALELFDCPDEAQLLSCSLMDLAPGESPENLNRELETAAGRYPARISRALCDMTGTGFQAVLFPYLVHLEGTGGLAITGIRQASTDGEPVPSGRDPGQTAAAFASLSRRERQVLLHLAAGRLTKEVANELGLSTRTVESYRASLKRKTGARTAAELAIMLAGLDGDF